MPDRAGPAATGTSDISCSETGPCLLWHMRYYSIPMHLCIPSVRVTEDRERVKTFRGRLVDEILVNTYVCMDASPALEASRLAPVTPRDPARYQVMTQPMP